MTKDSNIHNLPNADTSRAEVEALIRAMPQALEIHPYLAQLRWSAYQAYIKVGFSEAQALELCTR